MSRREEGKEVRGGGGKGTEGERTQREGGDERHVANTIIDLTKSHIWEIGNEDDHNFFP